MVLNSIVSFYLHWKQSLQTSTPKNRHPKKTTNYKNNKLICLKLIKLTKCLTN